MNYTYEMIVFPLAEIMFLRCLKSPAVRQKADVNRDYSTVALPCVYVIQRTCFCSYVNLSARFFELLIGRVQTHILSSRIVTVKIHQFFGAVMQSCLRMAGSNLF